MTNLLTFRSLTSLLGPAVIAIALLLPSTSLPDQISSGDCSPPVKDLSGNIVINCYARPSGAPLFRVTYFRVGDTAVSLLTQGLLQPRWEKLLGGPQDIVQTPTLAAARDFLEKFSAPFSFDLVAGDDIAAENVAADHLGREVVIHQNEYAGTMRSLGRELATLQSYPEFPAYNLTKVFFPDLDAADFVYDPVQWPRGYDVFLTSYDGVDFSPVVWRYATRADLERYESNYMAFMQAASKTGLFSYPDYGDSHEDLVRFVNQMSKVISSLRYLTSERMPDDFLIVQGHEGVHGGWEFELMLRVPELVVAVIENISEQPIEVGDFTVQELAATALRTEAETAEALERPTSEKVVSNVFPIGVLNPAEKILVPIRFQFYGREYDKPKSWFWQQYQKRDASGRALISGVLGEKARPPSSSREPNLVPRFDFGPAWAINAIKINGVTYPVRPYNPNNFVLSAGFEKGSCPILFVWDERYDIWANEGNFLVGAVGPNKKATDVKSLNAFSGKFRIVSREGEDFFLDEVYILYEKPDGSREAVRPKAEKLRKIDDKGFVVAGRKWLDVELEKGSEPAGGKPISLVATGFYTTWYNADIVAQLQKDGH